MRKPKDKKKAAELWVEGKFGEDNLKQIFSREEIKNLKFGKRWIEETIEDIN